MMRLHQITIFVVSAVLSSTYALPQGIDTTPGGTVFPNFNNTLDNAALSNSTLFNTTLDNATSGNDTLDTDPFFTQPPTHQVPIDIVNNGNYTYHQCGTNASFLTNTFNILNAQNGQAIADAQATAESPSFTTFFKDAGYQSFVTEVLSSITLGGAMVASTAGGMRAAPSIVCISDLEQIQYTTVDATNYTADMFDNCWGDSTVAFNIQKTSLIVLCPEFFSLTAAPVSNPCLTTNSTGAGNVDTGFDLLNYQIYVLLRQLVQFYLSALGSPLYDVPHDVAVSASLTGTVAVYNRWSYAYYVASVANLCTFPTPIALSSNQTEILAVTSNQTANGFFPLDLNSTRIEDEVIQELYAENLFFDFNEDIITDVQNVTAFGQTVFAIDATGVITEAALTT